MARHTVEIDTPARLDEVLRSRDSLWGVRIQGLDLTPFEEQLRQFHDLHGLVVFGGVVTSGLAGYLSGHGAVVFPETQGAPVNIYRSTLYSPDELYAGLADGGYDSTPDALAYRWSRRHADTRDIYVTLQRAIHDDAISDALDDALVDRHVVGVMGGHALARDSAGFADAAWLGAALAKAGHTVLTGGGPGAMEAANLGAMAGAGLADALARLATVPFFADDVTSWAHVALAVRSELTAAQTGPTEARPAGLPQSIGVPTWFYGHEPPNVFCDGIAKYFSNAVREDGLLSRCTDAVIVLPGAAGTVQEIFQAVTPMYYGAEHAPMPRLILVGKQHWSQTVPVWDTVQMLALGRDMADHVALVDSGADAATLLAAR